MAFDTYEDSYDQKVQDSISFIKTDHDFFIRANALHLLSVVRRLLGEPKQLEALDVGCGIGLMDRHLASHFGTLEGIDVSEGVLQTARGANPSVRYQLYDGLRFPHPDQSFDIAFCVNVMHHVEIPRRPAFLAEVRRVVRPGGLCVIFKHNPFNPLTRRAVHECEFDKDASLLTKGLSRDLLMQTGFQVAEEKFILFFPFDRKIFRRLENWILWVPMEAQFYIVACLST